MKSMDEKIKFGTPTKLHRNMRDAARRLQNKIVELYWDGRDRTDEVSNGLAKQGLNDAVREMKELLEQYDDFDL